MKSCKVWLLAALGFVSNSSFATAVFDGSNLNLSAVKVESATYTNVVLALIDPANYTFRLTAATQQIPAGPADIVFDPSTGGVNIPLVAVGASNYIDVVLHLVDPATTTFVLTAATLQQAPANVAPFGPRIAGGSNTIVLRDDGSVWTWGNIPSGTNGAPTSQLTPVQVSGLSDIRAVAAGGNFQYPFFYALHQGGSVFAWGSNQSGQLGDGTTTHRQAPLAIPGLTRVIAIAAAEYTGYALREDGTVWSWGYNYLGQLGIGSAALNATTPQQIQALANIVAIAAFDQIAVAVRDDGALFGWGQGSNLTLPGTWPYSGGQRRSATQIPGISGAVAARPSGGIGGLFALVGAERSALAWGSNANGLLGVGVFSPTAIPTPTLLAGNLQPWAGIRGCSLHSLGWTAAGFGYAWGSNSLYGAIGDPAVVNRTATPNRVPGLDQVVEMACGSEYHSIAIRANGEVWTWGNNNRGQIGDGSTNIRPSPVMVFKLNGPP